ncbi:L,D-transpeptidase family protein [Cohaesibacter haloalkalitolerans]|uniref:L,D-transpeptidase family protein n=1 Tax=Cohaesibacter haloalkalitolerans TaxID=1162980 RepID=UPI0013C46DF6|nr:L,D-transpeptidase family protein [Cohaesibacter haloalkalitolerans]
MKRTLAALLAATLCSTAATIAAKAAEETADQSLVLFGEHASNAAAVQIEDQLRVRKVLDNLHRVTLGAMDQQADRDIADSIEIAVNSIPQSADFLTKRDNAALVAFYQERSFRPAWFEDGKWTASARQLIFNLARADRDGLDPADYKTPSLGIVRARGASADTIAEADIALSLAITRYTRHAYAGRVDPRIFSKKEVTIKPHYPDSIGALDQIAKASDPVTTMRSYNPQHKGFLALRAEYNRLRAASTTDTTPPVAEGKSLKIGMRDERVPLIRRKLGLPAVEDEAEANLYSKDLAKTVEKFQADNGLIADGITGNATLAVLNDNRKDLVADLVANMERWRWLPRDLGDFHVLVNIPTYTLEVVKNGKTIHETRVVVGQKAHKTPLFSDEMEYLVVNPYWNVPSSIASKELLPKIKADPAAFFSNTNYQVLASVKGKTQVIDPAKLDWDRVEANMVRLRQTPGDYNALGDIKFMFPNQHAVYLHDTPSRSLFNRDYRAFSHGCVRVNNPMEFADVVLSQTAAWDAKRIKALIGSSERRVNLDRKIPVHLAYFTTWMSDAGTLQLRPDIYGHNKTVKQALGL